MKLPSNW